MVNINLDYISIREEYHAITDKTKAYEVTHKDMREQLENRTIHKARKFNKLLKITACYES